MNFFTYLWVRFTQSMLCEFIVGILALPFLAVILFFYVVGYPVIWVGMVYAEWKDFKGQDV